MIEKVSERLLAGEHQVMKEIMQGKSGSCFEQRGNADRAFAPHGSRDGQAHSPIAGHKAVPGY
jgi:hypothetical protein